MFYRSYKIQGDRTETCLKKQEKGLNDFLLKDSINQDIISYYRKLFGVDYDDRLSIHLSYYGIYLLIVEMIKYQSLYFFLSIFHQLFIKRKHLFTIQGVSKKGIVKDLHSTVEKPVHNLRRFHTNNS